MLCLFLLLFFLCCLLLFFLLLLLDFVLFLLYLLFFSGLGLFGLLFLLDLFFFNFLLFLGLLLLSLPLFRLVLLAKNFAKDAATLSRLRAALLFLLYGFGSGSASSGTLGRAVVNLIVRLRLGL